MTRYFTSEDSIVTSRRRVVKQSTSEMSPYFTMTKCNKLFYYRVAVKAGLWTLDWTVDWTMDWTMD